MFGPRRRETRAEIVARILLESKSANRRALIRSREEDPYGTRFTMPLPLFSSGPSFPVRNSRGEVVMKVDGEPYRLHGLILIRDPQGRELHRTSTRLVDIPDAMYIEKPNGELAAVVRNAFLSSPSDCWTVSVQGSEAMSTIGDVHRHAYSLHLHNGLTVAAVAKNRRWLPSSLIVEVADSMMAPLMLAVVVSIDVLSRGKASRSLKSPPPSARSA